AEDLRALTDRKDGFSFRTPLRTMRGQDLVLVDQTARQLNSEGIVAFGVLRDHPELAAVDAACHIDLFHRDFCGGPALYTVAGSFLRQRDQESDDDLIAEGVGQSRERQRRDEHTTEEDERSLHRVSSLRESPFFMERNAAGSCRAHHLLPCASDEC